MKKWNNRPPEIASLLNPAFCSLLILTSLHEYVKIDATGAPFPFPFILLPLILHKPTRKILPKTHRTTFAAWITNGDTVKAKNGFAERAKNISNYVRESLVFSVQNRYLEITNTGSLKPVFAIKKSFPNATQEVNECIRASSMCGKWIAMIGDFKMAMALLGVKP